MTTKLSPAMEAAMRKLTHRGQSSYGMGVGLNTLAALRRRGLVDVHMGLGSFSCPQVSTKWRLTEKGERRRKAEAVIELVRRA